MGKVAMMADEQKSSVGVLGKTSALLSLLPRRRQEFYDRVATVAEVRLERLFAGVPAYEAVDWESAIQSMEVYFSDAADVLGEPALVDIEDQVRQRLEDIHHKAIFNPSHSADVTLARCCYLACRLLKPTVILETGVAYGVTSAFILRALKENRRGLLYSVDLPPLGPDSDRYVGAAIPEEIKSRWKLHRGASKRVLPKLLDSIGTVDIFVHDSLHTYRNMTWEFKAILPHLSSNGIIIADDIQGNQAFNELHQQVRFWQVIRSEEKQSLFGIAII
jgi:Methyltransferase domain